MSRILNHLIAALARLAFRSGRSTDLEIIVLRHQLAAPRRQIDRTIIWKQHQLKRLVIDYHSGPRRRLQWTDSPFGS